MKNYTIFIMGVLLVIVFSCDLDNLLPEIPDIESPSSFDDFLLNKMIYQEDTLTLEKGLVDFVGQQGSHQRRQLVVTDARITQNPDENPRYSLFDGRQFVRVALLTPTEATHFQRGEYEFIPANDTSSIPNLNSRFYFSDLELGFDRNGDGLFNTGNDFFIDESDIAEGRVTLVDSIPIQLPIPTGQLDSTLFLMEFEFTTKSNEVIRGNFAGQFEFVGSEPSIIQIPNGFSFDGQLNTLESGLIEDHGLVGNSTYRRDLTLVDGDFQLRNGEQELYFSDNSKYLIYFELYYSDETAFQNGIFPYIYDIEVPTITTNYFYRFRLAVDRNNNGSFWDEEDDIYYDVYQDDGRIMIREDPNIKDYYQIDFQIDLWIGGNNSKLTGNYEGRLINVPAFDPAPTINSNAENKLGWNGRTAILEDGLVEDYGVAEDFPIYYNTAFYTINGKFTEVQEGPCEVYFEEEDSSKGGIYFGLFSLSENQFQPGTFHFPKGLIDIPLDRNYITEVEAYLDENNEYFEPCIDYIKNAEVVVEEDKNSENVYSLFFKLQLLDNSIVEGNYSGLFQYDSEKEENRFSYDEQCYFLNAGLIRDEGPRGQHYEYEFLMVDGNIQLEMDGQGNEGYVLSNSKHGIGVNLFSNNPNGFQEGTFYYSYVKDGTDEEASAANFGQNFFNFFALAFDTNGDDVFDDEEDAIFIDNRFIIDGRVIVQQDNPEKEHYYKLEWEIELIDNTYIRGSYQGEFLYEDAR